MKLQLLVPTMHKNKQGIIDLFYAMNIHSDVLFANQCDSNWEEKFILNGFNIHVISTNTRGVSKNRNILLKNFEADYGLFMDDDGIMNDNYPKIVLDFVKNHSTAGFVKFNFTLSSCEDNRPHYLIKANKKAKYSDVSPFGMPGFLIKKEVAQLNKALFDENVGTPNYVSHGEDSLFIKLMFDLKIPTFVSKDYIGHINNENSSWFNDFDERYFVSQGYLYTAMHGNLYWLYVLRMYLIHRKEYNYKYKAIKHFTKTGHKMFIGGNKND